VSIKAVEAAIIAVELSGDNNSRGYDNSTRSCDNSSGNDNNNYNC